MKYKIIILILFFTPLTGSFAQSSQSILAALHKLPGYKMPIHARAIVIIADNSCIKCNQELARVMAQYLEKPDVSFVISANPAAVDLSPYYSKAHRNVYFDREQALVTSNTVKSSTVLLFKQTGAIEQVIELSYQDAGKQIEYLKRHLK